MELLLGRSYMMEQLTIRQRTERIGELKELASSIAEAGCQYTTDAANGINRYDAIPLPVRQRTASVSPATSFVDATASPFA